MLHLKCLLMTYMEIKKERCINFLVILVLKIFYMDLLGSLAVIIQGRLQYAETCGNNRGACYFLLDNRQTALTKKT